MEIDNLMKFTPTNFNRGEISFFDNIEVNRFRRAVLRNRHILKTFLWNGEEVKHGLDPQIALHS